MGVWAKMLLNWITVTQDTQDINIPADHIKYLDINKQALASGATGATFAQIQAALVGYVRMKLGGVGIVNIRLDDLQALNAKWMQRLFNALQLGAGDNYHMGWLSPFRLPLFVDKKGRELSAQFPYTAQYNADTVVYNVNYKYRDTPFSERGELHYAYETFLGVGAAQTRINISRVGAELVGILIYCTHCGIGEAGDPEVSEFKLICDDREVWHDNWKCRGDERSPSNNLDDTVYGAILPGYWWISFEEQPWAADNLWALCLNTAFAGGTPNVGAFRLIAVYREP